MKTGNNEWIENDYKNEKKSLLMKKIIFLKVFLLMLQKS